MRFTSIKYKTQNTKPRNPRNTSIHAMGDAEAGGDAQNATLTAVLNKL